MEKILYFAYGSNMEPIQMSERCPDSKKLGVGVLRNYKLVSSLYSIRWKGGVFSIEKSEGSIVEGVLYSISPGDLESLDRYEGYPRQYRREELEIVLKDSIQKAIVYIGNRKEKHAISEEYFYMCAEAAVFHGINLLYEEI